MSKPQKTPPKVRAIIAIYSRQIDALQKEIIAKQDQATRETRIGLRKMNVLSRKMMQDVLMAYNDSCIDPPEPGGDGTLTDRAKEILEACERSAADDVMEPPKGPGGAGTPIDIRIRTKAGLNWTWEDPYESNGDFAWCGAEAAHVLDMVGLKYEIKYKVMASCSRLLDFCRGTPRAIPVAEAKPGDIVVWGNDTSPDWGSHITILKRRVSEHEWLLHEGNAVTISAVTGETREGNGEKTRDPIRKNSSTYHAQFAYRFLEEDFD